MIETLRKRFIIISMSCVCAVTLVLIGSINFLNIYRTNENIANLLVIISDNDGKFPKSEKNRPPRSFPMGETHITAETPFETRYFTVKLDGNSDVLQINTGNIAAISSEQAQEYAKEISSKGLKTGFLNMYRYVVTTKDYGELIVFLDCSTRMRDIYSLLTISILIAIISMIVLFVLISHFSVVAIRPIAQSIEKQKQFITDASHEIKTPLAIISADTDVLEIEIGQSSEWIDSIRNQVLRLNELVKHMVSLSRLDEEKLTLQLDNMSLSDTVKKISSQFISLAKSKQINFSVKIESNILIDANEESISQLVSILLDNAVKYTEPDGEISIVLSKKVLIVENTYLNLTKVNPDKLFDRFYRCDNSRSRDTGGYGLGLSIAKAIVQAHNFKISSYYKDNLIGFKITF